ncbi:helix-turn-helix transcriptional regulator, partial [Xanthomonas citri]|uniref:helix-turn-helix transcriptional regulator n=1 Tax=Xanthomonas citri TaxID=346 RepID=UPI001CC13AD6
VDAHSVTEFDLKQSAFFGTQVSVLCAHATTLRQGGVLHLEVESKLSNEVRGHEPSEPAFDQTLLDRLDAIFQSIQSIPDLDQAIRLPAVLDLVGVSKSTWYALLNPRSKTFDSRAPQPFKLGPSPNSPSVWWRSDVMAYLRACASPQAWAEGEARP